MAREGHCGISKFFLEKFLYMGCSNIFSLNIFFRLKPFFGYPIQFVNFFQEGVRGIVRCIQTVKNC